MILQLFTDEKSAMYFCFLVSKWTQTFATATDLRVGVDVVELSVAAAAALLLLVWLDSH